MEPGTATKENSIGYLALRPNGEGFYQLVIAGSNSEGLKKAVRALATDIATQTTEEKLFIRHVLPPERQKQHREGERSITLNELGYSEIKLAGAFHQRTTITVRRPPGWAIGPGSYVRLYFRHSSLLNPARSAVTIYVNGRLLKSLALNAGNAEKGELKAFIPRDELDKAEWNIEFAFYHDIGTADCSKKYEEVAWSVIEKETCVYLARGKNYYTARWADFPYFDLDKTERVALWLPEHPSASVLTLAALLAARVGQVYGNGIEWKVYMGEKQFPENEHCLFVLAHHNELARIAKNIEGLPVKPEAGGSFTISPGYLINPDYLEKNVICQVMGRQDGAIYYIFSSKK
ncbi:MAG: cellulose biosynthesis cyclic di-GMP-binding regulatory protein BcsB [Desulfotomaculales bacterium]